MAMKTLQQLADEGLFTKSAEQKLIKQQLFDMIKDSAQKNAIGRQVVQVIPLREGSSLDFDLADANSMKVRKMSEAGEAPLTRETYTKISVTPVKYGGNVKITSEMIEDSNFELIERNLRQIGREMANKETEIILDSFHANFTAVSSAGTELGIVDLTSAMNQVETADFSPNAMVLHPKQVNELRNIDTFVEADKVGDRRTFENGFVGRIFAMDGVITTIQTSDKVDVLDTNEAGGLVIRRPLTVERWNDPLRDLINATVTQRMAAVTFRATAGATITVA